ncbi:hypothetical protein BS47DRAFT_1393839 [Hydnum rufescens UP504]|uniref:Uncharacterized protein n=1 Tax=Hydnum rufescens UP504 TaxID=1448309 RepID=A0A9P6AVI9_9AGAM|nr:hypothetical protein BS47DRAFT_1393839 [Hydnum rufescens UP504]
MKLSETGRGLHADEMTEDSDIKNLYDKIVSGWPLFATLHPWWRELLNYNPIAVTNSKAGKDYSARAESLFHGDSERPHTPSMDNEEIPEMPEVEANQEDDGLDNLAEEFAGLVMKCKYCAEAEAKTRCYAENRKAHQHELEMEKLKLQKMELELAL